MKENNDTELEKNKQRISLLQLKMILIISIGAGTFGIIKQSFTDLSVFNVSVASIGCILVILLTAVFVKSYLKTQKTIR